jgi:23S rRNA (adenine1618-N6)-methyltransferase
VWKRAYRREYEKKKKQGVQAGEQGRKVVLAFRITVLAGRVVVEWLRGSDQVLWESFCGLVHRYFREK